MLYRRRRRYAVRRPRKRVYRSVKRVSKRYPKRSFVPRAIGLPKQMFAKLRWTTNYSANVAASSSANRDFRLNSLYDPDYTSTGEQPYYFDQYSAMFARYRVYGVKVNILSSCSANTTDLFHPTLILTSYCDVAPSWSTALDAESAKRSVRKILIPGQTSASISRYYDLRSIAGVSKLEYNSVEVFQALTTTNPSRPIFLSVTLANQSGTVSITWAFNLQLTFYCKFFDNVEPPGS